MAIYAYGTPGDNAKPFIYNSLVNDQISRFLWSWFHDCNLNRLKNVDWDLMTDDEKASWKKGHRLLDFLPGDWVLHKNVPEWGKVTAARLSSEYFYQNPLPAPGGDGRHCFHVDKVFTFDRKDERVHPDFYRKINVRGALHGIYSEKEFYQSLRELGYQFDDKDYEAAKKLGLVFDKGNNTLEDKLSETKTSTVNIPTAVESSNFSEGLYLNREANNFLSDLTKSIYRNKPGKRLESFLAEVFRKIPGVIEVKENGSGWKTDYGADLIVKYNLERIKGVELEEQTWVVQVKSYEGAHWDTNAVSQIQKAIEKFEADVGIIITTGERTQALEIAFNNLADDMRKKNVSLYLISGVEVAQFVLRYGLDLLI